MENWKFTKTEIKMNKTTKRQKHIKIIKTLTKIKTNLLKHIKSYNSISMILT